MVWKPCVSDCAMGIAVEDHFALKVHAAVDSMAEGAAGNAGGQEHERVDLTAAAVAFIQLDRQSLRHRVFNGGAELRLSRIQGDGAS